MSKYAPDICFLVCVCVCGFICPASVFVLVLSHHANALAEICARCLRAFMCRRQTLNIFTAIIIETGFERTDIDIGHSVLIDYSARRRHRRGRLLHAVREHILGVLPCRGRLYVRTMSEPWSTQHSIERTTVDIRCVNISMNHALYVSDRAHTHRVYMCCACVRPHAHTTINSRRQR